MYQQPVKKSHFLRVHQFRLDMFVSGPTLHPVKRLAYERMYWTPLAEYLADLLADECTLDVGLDPAEVAASLAVAQRATGRDPQPVDGNTPLGDIVALARALALPLRVVRTARWISAATYAQRNPEVIARLADAIPQTDAHSGVACIDEYDVDPAIYPALARPVPPTPPLPGLVDLDFVRRLFANVDDFHEERIDFETFSERQRDLWATLGAAGPEVKRAVLEDTIWRLAEDSDLVLHPSINEHT